MRLMLIVLLLCCSVEFHSYWRSAAGPPTGFSKKHLVIADNEVS